jgi:hypothetical protein
MSSGGGLLVVSDEEEAAGPLRKRPISKTGGTALIEFAHLQK